MLLQPITVPFSKSTLKPSVYTLKKVWQIYMICSMIVFIVTLNARTLTLLWSPLKCMPRVLGC